MSGDLVAGVDVGSQGTCAQLLDRDGTLVAAAYASHELSYPRPGWAEQDPQQWLDALARALAEVAAEVGPDRIAALAFGSQLDGLVAVDRRGEPLRPALIWMDRRAGDECAEIGRRLEPGALRALTGCNLDPGHVAAKIAWLARHEPDCHRDARFMLPGAFVAWRASGELAIDPTNASSTMLLDPIHRAWCGEACEAFGVDPESLPPVRPAHAVLGPVSDWLREAAGLAASTLVVLGCGDEMAATLGAGVVDAGSVCDVIGTAEPVCVVCDSPRIPTSPVVELHPHADPESWLFENPGWLSGGAYRWLRDQLGPTGDDAYERLDAEAASVPAGCDGVLWLPALAGAMTPEWNERARATWFGLTAAHTRAHMVRALLEGNAFALRNVLEAIALDGIVISEIVCVAGGARGGLLRELRADVCGVPVIRPTDVETTARGAAMLAAVGAGWFETVREASLAMRDERLEAAQPQTEHRAVYDEQYRRYHLLYEQLRPLF